MLKEVNQSLKFLSKKDKRKLIILSCTKFLNGILDFAGIASVMPIIAIVANQNLITESKYLFQIKNFFSLTDKNLLIMLILFSIFLLLLNYSFRIIDSWYDSYVGQEIWKNLSAKLFKYYIKEDYVYHLKNSSNSLLEKLNVKVNFIVIGIIQPFFQIIGKSFSSLLIFSILLILQPLATIILTFVIVLFFQIVYFYIRNKIERYGKEQAEASKQEYKIIDQALKSIKDIKINQTFNFYKNYYYKFLEKSAESSVKKVVFMTFPRNLLELISYFLIYLFVMFMLFVENSQLPEIAVIIAIYLISLQRILPNAQTIFSEFSNYKFYRYAHQEIFNDLNSNKIQIEDNKKEDKDILDLKKKIEIDKIRFYYPDSKNFNLNINQIDIDKGNFIGICGKSGSGKSTLINLITGLLKPSEGSIFIDGKKLNMVNLQKWQRSIAYVPQSPFIADDTIKNNIAYGLPEEEIDFSKVQNASKISKLDGFIQNNLPNKYDTLVGEDGVRLSGGQKQRISIARAIYFNRKIVILDESTSSLDLPTEQEILNSIVSTQKDKTIIFITHRVLSLKKCDKIILLKNGRIEALNSYESLIKSSSAFNNLIQESNKKD